MVSVFGFINTLCEINSDMHMLSGCVLVCRLKSKRQTQVGNPPPAALEEEAALAPPVAGVLTVRIARAALTRCTTPVPLWLAHTHTTVV